MSSVGGILVAMGVFRKKKGTFVKRVYKSKEAAQKRVDAIRKTSSFKKGYLTDPKIYKVNGGYSISIHATRKR